MTVERIDQVLVNIAANPLTVTIHGDNLGDTMGALLEHLAQVGIETTGHHQPKLF